MNRRDWREVSLGDVDFNETEVAQQLVPTLHAGAMRNGETVLAFGRRLVTECQEGLSVLLPFTDKERLFLDKLLDAGIIAPELLTDDSGLRGRIDSHPLLVWKAQNVREYKNRNW